MPCNWASRQRRKDVVKIRAAVPDAYHPNCRVYGCGNPSRAGSQDGLDQRFCRRHADHKSRHGSAYKGSYSAAEINPYRRAAIDWLIANPNDRWATNAVQRVETLYANAGPFIEAFRLRGQPPRVRATNMWARLRRHEVDPRIIVAAWLAVEMVIADDRRAVSTTEFKRVQAAKVAHRLASGTHKQWQQRTGVVELHKYPASRGNVLRHIGADLEEVVGLLVEHQLAAIRRSMLDRPASATPHPRTVRVRRRSKGE